MFVSSSSDLTTAANFSRRHPRVTEIAPQDSRADHSKSRTNDRCISPTALRRSLRPEAFALAQKRMRGKASGPQNQEARDVGEEIYPTEELSLCSRVPQSTAHVHVPAQEPMHPQSTSGVAQPAGLPP